MLNLNLAEYHDKVLGCWTGKNIGGTLGGPFEGIRTMPDVKFYTMELNGEPLPNDDLDLQLIWLCAAEELGVFQLTPRRIAEYWMNYMSAPMSEYFNCVNNIARGFYPPLSGSCNNKRWKLSNGAWIRSEIWATLFPGNPDEAIRCAYIDSCADHCGDGIYAELFTAAMESAAFVLKDIRKIISVGLSKIPADSLIARSVQKAVDLYDAGTGFTEARNAIVEYNSDTGFFQAPQELGFLTLALLYGEGEFEKSIQLAVHCGDDTDCTAATAGAILGIIYGRKNLPEKWCSPIGNAIITKCLTTFALRVPKTVDELTDRVVALAKRTRTDDPGLLALSDKETSLEGLDENALCSSKVAQMIWKRSPYEFPCELSFALVGAVLEDGPEIEPGVPKKIRFIVRKLSKVMGTIQIRLQLPETWQALTPTVCTIAGTKLGPQSGEYTMEIVPGELDDEMFYLPVEFKLSDRQMPEIALLPFQRRSCAVFDLESMNNDDEDRLLRRLGLPVKFPACELGF